MANTDQFKETHNLLPKAVQYCKKTSVLFKRTNSGFVPLLRFIFSIMFNVILELSLFPRYENLERLFR